MDTELKGLGKDIVITDMDDWTIIKHHVKRLPLTKADIEANRIIAMDWDDMLRYCFNHSVVPKDTSMEKMIISKK